VKTPATLFLLLVTFSAFTQKTDESYSLVQYKKNTCRSLFPKLKLNGEINQTSVVEFLKEQISNLKDYRTGLKLNYINQSPGGFHYSFHQTFNGISIYQTEIKVNVDRQNTIRSVFDNSENTSNWNLNTSGINNNSIIAIRQETGEPVLTVKKILNGHLETLLAGNEIVFQRDMNTYLAQDSSVTGKVFLPDPLTSSQQSYNCPYCDNNDATNSQLDTELQTVNFTTTFTGSQFILENAYVKVSDFDLPNLPPVTSNTPQFYYDRSQSGFEDVNAFYHINTLQKHIHSLGFGCADSLVNIDTHAMNGDDNSYFSPIQTPRRIYYGTGGVDDAEDADVCVHEYGHFISYTASPGSNSGTQRESLDEGFGDYLAGSYSNALSSYNNTWVFNWDGHNEFWNGRVLNSNWIYPTDLTGSIYHNAQIWSAVLWCIHNSIGRVAIDSIILEAHYSYAQNMSMPDAAQLLLDADTLLTGGVYTCSIYSCLFQHGLQPVNPFINCGVGIKEEEEAPSIEFSSNTNSFSIYSPTAARIKLQLINVAGQQVEAIDENQPFYHYENSTLPPGVYLLTARINGKEKTYKWCKIN